MSNKSGSIGEMLMAAKNQIEVDARQSSYAVATQVVTSVLGRFRSNEAKDIVLYWSEIADGVFKKIKSDADELTNRK